MNINQLQEKLLRVARSNPPSDQVPLGFEKRILAHVQTETIMDALTLWARALWRAAVPCVVVMFLLSIWVAFNPGQTNQTTTANLGTELESTLMASVSFDNELSW